MKINERHCPQCHSADTYAVANVITGRGRHRVIEAGCGCRDCDHRWIEYAYGDGTISNAPWPDEDGEATS